MKVLTKSQAIKILNELYAFAKLTDLGVNHRTVDDFFKKRGFLGFEDFMKKTKCFDYRDPKFRKIDQRAWSILTENWIASKKES